MPDVRISELPSQSDAPAAGDLFALVDVSDTSPVASGRTKKLTWAQLLAALPPSAGGVTAEELADAVAAEASARATAISTAVGAEATARTSAISTAVAGREPTVAAGTSGQFYDGTKTFRAIAAADLPIVGLTIRGWLSPIATLTDGATVTLDAAASASNVVTIAGNRTIAFTNVGVGASFSLEIHQDPTGSRTVTWPGGVTWLGTGGVAPTLPTAANAVAYFAFKCVSAGVYRGFYGGASV